MLFSPAIYSCLMVFLLLSIAVCKPEDLRMPVNTSSTGATYGKSSDPLCPLGFHPQVRWPTRCKRCFRDYKEHNDSNDQGLVLST